jgi:pseudomonalisin
MSRLDPFFVFLLVTDCLLAQAPRAKPAPRIHQPVDDSRRVILRGHTHPLARPAFDRGPAPPDLPLDRILLVLNRSSEQQQQLDQYLVDLQDPSSSQYHQWITPEEFGLRFGVSDQDVQIVNAWLAGHGFHVQHVSAGRNFVEFSGTAGEFQRAFGVAMHRYAIGGEMHWANSEDPSIPAALSPVVQGFASLHDFYSKPQVHAVDGPIRGARSPSALATLSSGTHGLGPSDFATIYNIRPVYQVGMTGMGSTIAILGRSNINVQDVADFRQLFGLAANPPQVIINGTDPGIVGGGEQTEATLDATWAGAVAPGATVKLVVSKSTNTTDGIFLSEVYAVDNNISDIIGESFGACEVDNSGAAASVVSMAQQAAAQGMTFLVSSGDSGSAGCDDPSSASPAAGPLSVNILASTPYTIGVGGTQFNDTSNAAQYWSASNSSGYSSALSYIPENVWNQTCASCGNLWAGGGGASALFAKPAWQAGVPGIPADGHRDLPDVSLTASGHDPYMLCMLGSCRSSQFYQVSGTSASAAAFAGIMALVKQETGARLGQANSTFYRLAAQQSYGQCNGSLATGGPASSCIFNDITAGNNAVPGEAGYGTAAATYTAAAGYDLATGLGSVNVYNLMNNWRSLPVTTAPAASLAPSSISFGTVAIGSTAPAQAVTLTNSGTATLAISSIAMAGANPGEFSQTNNCGSSVAPGASCTIWVWFTPAAASVRSASLMLTDNATGSPQSIRLSGNGLTPAILVSSQGVGIFRVSNGLSILDTNFNRTLDGADQVTLFAGSGLTPQTGDIAVSGRWSGTGTAKVGLYRPSTGTWFLDYNGNGVYDGPAVDRQYQYGGLPGDIPVVGDWNGTGFSKVGIFRQGFLWILNTTGTGVFSSSDAVFGFGGLTGCRTLPYPYNVEPAGSCDIPVVGDWNGSGTSKVGVFRAVPGTSQPFLWVLDTAGSRAFVASGPNMSQVFAFGGVAGDIPLVSDWNNTGATNVGVFRMGFFWVEDTTFNTKAGVIGGPASTDTLVGFGYGGIAGDQPIVGPWR